MPRKPASAFVSAFALAIFCLVARLPAHATEMVAPGESDAVEAEVRGLSPDDLLNVRATASPSPPAPPSWSLYRQSRPRATRSPGAWLENLSF